MQEVMFLLLPTINQWFEKLEKSSQSAPAGLSEHEEAPNLLILDL